MQATEADFLAPEAIRNPYPLLHRLMDEAPAHFNPGLRAWVLTRYDDVVDAFRDHRLSSDRISPFAAHQTRLPAALAEELSRCVGLWMVFNDAPDHTRLRALAQRAFGPGAIRAMRPVVAAIASELIDGMIEKSAVGEPVDFLADFAFPLPGRVIAEILGVPPEDMGRLKGWSDELALFVLTSRATPDKYQRAAAALAQMNAYFAEIVARRRREPGERVIDELIAAEAAGDKLDLDEVIATCVLLLFAGHETTTHFFANGLWALATHREQETDLRTHRADPGIVANAVHEMLRWDGPSIGLSRVAAETHERVGVRLDAGDRVFLMVNAANRDPRVFPEPDRFDIRRDNARRQIAFGHGAHVCLCANLARLEGETAWPILLDRLARIDPLVDVPEWSDSIVTRSMKRLPVRIHPA
jgi:cytochrome P450